MSRAACGVLAAATGLAAAIWAAAFRTRFGASVDEAVLGGFLGLGKDHVHMAATRVARLADPGPIALLTAATVCVALARRRGRLALTVLAVSAAANASTQVLKRVTAEPRSLESLAAHVAPASWPSGHATAAMAAGLCLVAVAPRRLRPLAASLAAAMALGVGYSVMLLGWHFPSDVLGGYCVAAGWTLAGLAPRWASDRAGRRHIRIAAAPVGIVLGAGAAFASAALARTDPALVYARPTAAFAAFALVMAAVASAPAAGLAVLAGAR